MTIDSATHRKKLFTAPFMAAVVILGAAAVLAGPVTTWLSVKLTKESLPLKAPLNSLSEFAIRPYKKLKAHSLPPEIVEALGTEEYLSWVIEDQTKDRNDPLRIGNLLVTYYSGGPNFIPHTPDVCYLGSGYQPVQPHETLPVQLPSLQGRFGDIPVRILTFGKTAIFSLTKLSVAYTFGCNGEYAGDRERIRVLINQPRNKYAYFSKVEVSYPGATREQTLEGAKELFNVILPVLARDHWPNFQEAEKLAKEPKP